MKKLLIPALACSLFMAPIHPWTPVAIAQVSNNTPLTVTQQPVPQTSTTTSSAQDFVAVLDLDALGGVSKEVVT